MKSINQNTIFPIVHGQYTTTDWWIHLRWFYIHSYLCIGYFVVRGYWSLGHLVYCIYILNCIYMRNTFTLPIIIFYVLHSTNNIYTISQIFIGQVRDYRATWRVFVSFSIVFFSRFSYEPINNNRSVTGTRNCVNNGKSPLRHSDALKKIFPFSRHFFISLRSYFP